MPNTNIYETGEYWNPQNRSSHAQDAEFKFNNALRMLKRNQIAPASVLDVGCGGGKGTYLFANAFDVPTVGIDVARDSIADARNMFQHANLDYRVLPIEQFEQHVDLGLMFDVFEHVEDYFGFLRNARSKADHWLFNIPLDMNVASLLSRGYMNLRRSVGHIHYFSPASARATLEDCGYRIIDSRLDMVVLHRLKTGPTPRALIAAAPRLALSLASKSLVASVLGGVSMMVLCRA